jgi:nitrogen fixation/metabolism regulation signal transduction histidine kinase
MVFRNFHVAVVARTALLTGTCLALVYTAAVAKLEFTTVVIALVLAYQVWALIRYVEKCTRDVTRLLISIRQDDFSQSFPDDGRGGSHRALHRAMAEVLSEFNKVRAGREANFRYMNTIITHVETGLIGVGADGEIKLINPAAKRLLDAEPVHRLQDLARVRRPVADAIGELEPGGRSLVRFDRDGKTSHLSLAATEIRLADRVVKIVSLHDIGRELDERELETWRQLGRVLSHEIINSVTPIASLASSTRRMLGSAGCNGQTGSYSIETDAYEDLENVMETIAKRSQGLVRFVEDYRRLTRLPKPVQQVIRLSDLLSRVEQLLLARPDTGSIRIETSVEPPSLELMADPDLVEQIIINIGANAIQALDGREDGLVEISGRMGERGAVVIEVADNGPGIADSAIGRVFTPFFTTKTGGTGIGLSLARQIMRLHGGDVGVTSVPNKRTVFTLHF